MDNTFIFVMIFLLLMAMYNKIRTDMSRQERRSSEILTREGLDFVYVDYGLVLPEGLSIEEIYDAIARAKAYQKQEHFHVTAYIKEKVFSIDGKREISGDSNRRAANKHDIRVSLSKINAMASFPSEDPQRFNVGSAAQQLWAVTFEEALHAARRSAGVDDFANYFTVPVNWTNEDLRKYRDQPEEQAIDHALNNGILREKFGPTAVSINKRVLHYK